MISVAQSNHNSDPTTNMAEQPADNSSAPHGVQGAPNEAALLALMERTGYSMIQENGQRKYGGPPPGWDPSLPVPRGCEVFVGKIPRDCYEDELVPVFEKIGNIYELRLMMDFSGANRGYCFVTYYKRDEAKRAVKELNNFQIRKGRYLGVCLSVDNCRLFVGGIPKNKTKEEIMVEMKKVTEGVVDVIVYPSATDKSKNRGFAFVEYESHRAAAMARRKLIPGRIQLWGHTIAVDWAEPEQEVDEDVMSKVKILYVRNLMLSTTEETLEKVFNQAVQKENAVERVKKLRDYAFVHYREREDALLALQTLNGTNLEGTMVEVSLAKPVDKSEYGLAAGSTVPVQQSFAYAGLEAAAPYLGLPGYYPALGAAVNAAAGAGGVHGANKSLGARGVPMAGRGNPRGGRGRGAAGSRGAGGVQRTYVPPHMRGHRKMASDERLYDVVPGMELTPTNPFTLKPHSAKSASQILDEFIHKNGWGTPVYQLHSTVGGATGDVQLFLFKVSIPGLAGHYPTTQFQPNKLCRSVEEAKNYAAEYVLMQLGVPMEVPTATDPASLHLSQIPSPSLTATSASSATSPIPTSPASLYQGRPLAPTVPYTLTNGSAAAAAAAVALQQQAELASCYSSLPLATNQVPTTYTLVNPTHQGKIVTAPQAQLAQSYPAYSPIGFQQY